jgi:FSR family fosmidomycin resistance protein-like MFS transporter
MASGPGILELPLQPSARTPARAGMLALILYSFAHFWIDLYASALGALQPLLVEKLRLSLTQAGLAGGVLIFSSSVTQPLYGYLSDRFHSRLFSALAPAVAGVFICSLGIAPTYGWVLLAVVLGGAGISSFHPQASARAAHGMVSNRGKWFAIFISLGTLGWRSDRRRSLSRRALWEWSDCSGALCRELWLQSFF